jgi:hypothetical protein
VSSRHEIIGEEWCERSRELADWAMARLVNRRDVWGQYTLLSTQETREAGRTYRAMTLPLPERRGKDMVSLDKLARHFASRPHRRPQLIGLHAESATSTSLWLGIDIDNHDLEAPAAAERARGNLEGALAWWREFARLGYDPLLFDSSGRGGFHLWVLFAEPAPTAHVHGLARSIAATWGRHQLQEEPEVFPKAPRPGSLGAWLRLPGMHHTQPHYSRLWSGEEWLSEPWLDGHAAIDAMLQVIPGPPPPALPEEPTLPTPLVPAKETARETVSSGAGTRSRAMGTAERPRVCVDLDGVLADRRHSPAAEDLGEPIQGAVAFTRALAEHADIVIHAFLPGEGAAMVRAETRKAVARLRDWLDQHGFAYREIAWGVGKPMAAAYVDERGVSCRPLEQGPPAYEQALQAVVHLCDYP